MSGFWVEHWRLSTDGFTRILSLNVEDGTECVQVTGQALRDLHQQAGKPLPQYLSEQTADPDAVTEAGVNLVRHLLMRAGWQRGGWDTP